MDENECKAFEYERLLRTHMDNGHNDRAFMSQMNELITYFRLASHTYRTPLHRRGNKVWML